MHRNFYLLLIIRPIIGGRWAEGGRKKDPAVLQSENLFVTRMVIFIKAKLKNSEKHTNIDKYGVATTHIREFIFFQINLFDI